MQQGNKRFSLSALRRNYTDPHGTYDALREHDSIYFDKMSECWLVTGYAPVTQILGDRRFSSHLQTPSSPSAAASFLPTAISKQMVFMDGKAHQQAQEVILRPLAQLVKQMPTDIHACVASLLTMAQESKELDIVQEFAEPFSLQTIARILGIPASDPDELLQLEHWSDTFGNLTSGYLRGDRQDIDRLVEYFHTLIRKERETPSVPKNLLSALVEAHNVFPEDDDLISNSIMVFGAGQTTVKKLLGNGIPLLLPDWQKWRELFQHNALLPKQLAEELLRMVTPTRYLIRQASEDIDLSPAFPGKHHIRCGEKVLLFLEASNYDPAQFVEPASFHPQRRPNRHIAFGFGPHQCPGATLARMEIQIALEQLLAIPQLAPKPTSPPLWNTNPNLGGYTSFHTILS